MDKTIWFDITNTPHVNFFKPIIKSLSNNYILVFSLLDFAETVPMFDKEISRNYIVLGTHKGKRRVNKIIGMFNRIVTLSNKIPYFDIKISIGGDASNYLAKLRRKLSITFDDNETSFNVRYSRFTDFAFWPEAVPKDVLLRQGFKSSSLYQYHGYKEDVYLADYVPNNNFMNQIPFNNYILVRPENLQANYINNDKVKTISPKLLRELSKSGYNILYLPRYKMDKEYAKGIDNVYIPEEPVNGLDACYFADAVLTGAGTFAREAACLGVPSFSFFAGKQLLSVDKALIKEKKMFWSRDVGELIEALKKSEKRNVDLTHSKNVQEEVISKLLEVIKNWTI